MTRIPAEAVDALVEAASSGAPTSAAAPLTAAEHRAAYATALVGLVEREGACSPDTSRLRALLARHRIEILEIASRRRIESVRVFGSVARGDAHPDSDIDLLVQPSPQASLFDLSGFAGEVEALLGARVDVVDAGSLKPSLRACALAEAVPL